MIERLSFVDGCLHVHAQDSSLKTTKSFTHGSIVFDLESHTATVGSLEPVHLPQGFVVSDGDFISLQLVAPDGSLRKQTRTGNAQLVTNAVARFRIAGQSKTPAKFSAEDGWGIVAYRYRCYFDHPGVATDPVPDWLKESVRRQKSLWNRLCWLCRDARRRCSPVPTAEIVAFVNETILPTIDQFNASLGRSKDKIKHPVRLKIAEPGLDGLWKFAGMLRGLTAKGRPVPDGLMEKTVAFAEQFKADYTPINVFLSSVDAIGKRESESLILEEGGSPVKLRAFETRPVMSSFKATLARRKTAKSDWSSGWPMIQYSDSPRAADWGLHYYFNKAGVDAALLETDHGVPGLTFDEPLATAETGHDAMKGKRTSRKLRRFTIDLPGDGYERWTYSAVCLQHRPLPPNSHMKEWKLLYKGGKLWLCMIIEVKRSIFAGGSYAAGLDIGWRRTKTGIRFGTLYEPQSNTFRELTMDLGLSPTEHHARLPFQTALGPTRWEKRRIKQLLPEWRPGEPIPNCFDMRPLLGQRRSAVVLMAKAQLRKCLGEQIPAWIDKAGSRGLMKIGQEFPDHAEVQAILSEMEIRQREIDAVVPEYLARATGRIEVGHQHIAHDVCRYLQQKGTNRLIVETSFLAKAAQNQDNRDGDALRRSQKYRQFAAVGKFIAVLKQIARNYGIIVEALEAINTTRICHHCNHLNAANEKDEYPCEECHMVLYQDQNASINLSRFGTGPELASQALTASAR